MIALRHKIMLEVRVTLRGHLPRDVFTTKINSTLKRHAYHSKQKYRQNFLRNNETRKFTLAENFNTFIGMYKEVVSNYI